jgi:hypothetical protein
VESPFDAAYGEAVSLKVDEELLPADRQAAFNSACDTPRQRHASDLMPSPAELALRAAFGHLF